MPFFLVDDGFHKNEKARKLLAEDPAAIGLWTAAGSWSMDDLTDGVIPDHQLPWLIPKDSTTLAKKLVAAGLWKRVKGGYRFVNWDRRQKSKATILTERQREALRKALAMDPVLRQGIRNRDKDRCRYCAVRVKWNDKRGPGGATYDLVDPGQKTIIENVVISCRACYAEKSNRSLPHSGMTLLRPGTIVPPGLESNPSPDLVPPEAHTVPSLKGTEDGSAPSGGGGPSPTDPAVVPVEEELTPEDRDERDWRWRLPDDPETIRERNKRGAAAARALIRSTDRQDPTRAEQRDERLTRLGIDSTTELLQIVPPSLMIVQSRGRLYGQPPGKHTQLDPDDDQEEAS